MHLSEKEMFDLLVKRYSEYCGHESTEYKDKLGVLEVLNAFTEKFKTQYINANASRTRNKNNSIQDIQITVSSTGNINITTDTFKVQGESK